jgi:hypothetical protein
MKPLAHTFRCLLVAIMAMSVTALPVMAHAAAGCKNDGTNVSRHHRRDCCCGVACHCAHCPGADTGKHSPAPVPTVPDDGRAVVKIHAEALGACVILIWAAERPAEGPTTFVTTGNLSTSLIAKHTCLRV